MMRILKSSYRGNDGFTICGTDPRGRSVRVFTRTRKVAEEVRDALKDNDQSEVDWLLRHEVGQVGP